MYTHAVVKFIKETENIITSEVPVSWLFKTGNEITKCWWPPANIASKTPLIMKKSVPDSTWTKEDVSVMRYFDSYYKARKFAQDSDYTSAEENLGKGFRLKKPNSQYQSNEEEYNFNPNQQLLLDLESPRSSTSANCVTPSNVEELSPLPLSPLMGINHDVGLCKTFEDQGTQTDRDWSAERLEQRIVNINENLEKQCTKTDFILRELAILNTKMDQLLQNASYPTLTCNQDGNVFDSLFPLDAEDDITCCEEFLKDETYVTELQSYVGKIGGETPAENIRNILKKVFTKKLAAVCSWYGRKGNMPVNKLKVMEVIKDTIINNTAEFTEAKFVNIVTEWFRFGKQRLYREQNRRPIIT
ncbi:uncharacterized protein LOC113381363 [Ctenocephalides felis]|uniref:uncharacterized protein LOC113380999 n=1 Tax=Ctenocephalides felis TaxID=7515 RepID=UPI000E6E4A3A|nr:uncharacterized protein LOC113380999 [Ctenocephalides felis]XP_026476088.1 uncharacterized protein LOC113381362 [Ctenocephalides felis]XP_026476089.1 uncharacterized protein LOC113381363 [Ctenocephalides felis]